MTSERNESIFLVSNQVFVEFIQYRCDIENISQKLKYLLIFSDINSSEYYNSKHSDHVIQRCSCVAAWEVFQKRKKVREMIRFDCIDFIELIRS